MCEPLARWMVVLQSTIGPFACYRRGDIVCSTIRSTRTWEHDVLTALRPHMTPRTVFVDVGSNVGWYAYTVAQSHDVVAFEPFHKNLLLQNATRCLQPDRAARVRLLPYGLSDRAQTCDLFQQEDVNHGDTHTVCTDAQRAAFSRKGYKRLGRASYARLDDVAWPALLAAEKVVKVDIEGHEYDMLRGATRFLAEGTPPRAWYVEVFQLGDRKAKVVDLFRANGYELRSAPAANNYLFVR